MKLKNDDNNQQFIIFVFDLISSFRILRKNYRRIENLMPASNGAISKNHTCIKLLYLHARGQK